MFRKDTEDSKMKQKLGNIATETKKTSVNRSRYVTAVTSVTGSYTSYLYELYMPNEDTVMIHENHSHMLSWLVAV